MIKISHVASFIFIFLRLFIWIGFRLTAYTLLYILLVSDRTSFASFLCPGDAIVGEGSAPDLGLARGRLGDEFDLAWPSPGGNGWTGA